MKKVKLLSELGVERYATVDGREGASENAGFDLGGLVAAGPDEVHVSGDNISLHVEFCSPEREIMHQNADDVENPEEPADEKNAVVIDNEGCRFSIGDIVWIKTKTKTKIWWPGSIEDPLDASKFGVKFQSEGCLLVRYFASKHVSWYLPSQLRPFYDNFMEFSRQNNSTGFLAAVEKAVDEFGIRLKSRLISNKPSVIGDFGEISATLLDSRHLVSHLKNLALASSRPRVLEPAILRGYFSAFYCSHGHVDLPMSLLRPMPNAGVAACGSGTNPSARPKNLSGNKTESDKVMEDICNSTVVKKGSQRKLKSTKRKRVEDCIVRDGGDDKVEGLGGPVTTEECSGSGPSGKVSDLRSRKKSRYLSYPYINVEGKELPAKVDDGVVGSVPISKPSKSSKFQQKWSKLLTDNPAEDLLSVSPIELLLGLRVAASGGYSYPGGIENIERIKGFFYRFRISSFHSDMPVAKIYSKNMATEKKKKKNKKAARPDEGSKKDDVLGKKNSEPPLTTTEDNGTKKNSMPSVNIGNASLLHLPTGEVGMKKNSMPSVNVGIASSLHLPTGVDDMQKNSMPGVNMGTATPLHFPIKESYGLPDLNWGVNSAVASDISGIGILPVIIGEAKKKRKRRKNIVTELKIVEKAAELNEGSKGEDSGKKNSESALATTEENGRKENPMQSVNIGFATPLHFPTSQGLADLSGGVHSAIQLDFSGKTVLPLIIGHAEGNAKKKRKRRKKEIAGLEKASETPVPIPDLNGTQMPANTSGKETQGLSQVPAEVDQRRWKRTTKGFPLVLTFSEVNPLPPKEVLEAEFSKFGTLKEVVAPSQENQFVGRVFFKRKSDAKFAHGSLEKGFPFGGAIVKFELQVSAPPSKALQNLTKRTAPFANGVLMNPCVRPLGMAARTGEPPTVPVLVPAMATSPAMAPAQAPPLDHIKRNLEMMTSMLKQAGDDLSPETKAKLELEIKGLLSKVSTMVSPPPSSS